MSPHHHGFINDCVDSEGGFCALDLLDDNLSAGGSGTGVCVDGVIGCSSVVLGMDDSPCPPFGIERATESFQPGGK